MSDPEVLARRLVGADIKRYINYGTSQGTLLGWNPFITGFQAYHLVYGQDGRGPLHQMDD